MLIPTQADMEGRWYNDPQRPKGEPPYWNSPQFGERAQTVRGRFSTGKILVAGCGYGYLVKHLIGLGLDAWGCDASDWCVARAAEVVPNRVIKADITVRSQLTSTLTFAGLRTNGRFTAIVTEDVFTCLTDAEIVTALTELRRITNSLFHILTAVEVEAERNPIFTWKTLTEWKAVVAPELVMSLETGTIS